MSVIIATFNREQVLPNVIKGLLAQKMAKPYVYEIIIVDNNSTDNTQNTVEALIPVSEGKLKYFKESLPGKSNALNSAIRQAQGEIIAFTDDDVEVDPLWLNCLIECFDRFNCDAVGGRVLPVYPSGTPRWAVENPNQMAGAVVIYDQGEKSFPVTGETPRFIGANWAFKRSVFQDCGYFRTDIGPGTPCKMGEDEEFYSRLMKARKSLYYCAEAVIWHPVYPNRLSLKHLINWHMSLGRFEAKKEYENHKESLNFFFGVPRYILKESFIDLFLIPMNIFNILKLRYYLRSFFRKVGMINEYNDISKKQ